MALCCVPVSRNRLGNLFSCHRLYSRDQGSTGQSRASDDRRSGFRLVSVAHKVARSGPRRERILEWRVAICHAADHAGRKSAVLKNKAISLRESAEKSGTITSLGSRVRRSSRTSSVCFPAAQMRSVQSARDARDSCPRWRFARFTLRKQNNQTRSPLAKYKSPNQISLPHFSYPKTRSPLKNVDNRQNNPTQKQSPLFMSHIFTHRHQPVRTSRRFR